MRVRAEARFITRCVCEPADLQPRELQQIGQVIQDWRALLDLAARHGVVGYVRRAIARDEVAVPPFVAEGLRNAALAQVAQVARLNAAMERILPALEAAAIPMIVLKGPVLSRLVYPDPNLRPYSDIDLLVRTYGDTLDWQAIRAGAHGEGVAGSIWYTLRLARAALATPVPSVLLQSLAPSLPVRVLYRLVWPSSGVANLHGHMCRRAVQFLAADSWRGMVPNLVLMGRRGARLRAMLSAVYRR